MSQSCFSLGFLFQNSLWKLSIICWYKWYLYWCVFGMWKVRFVTNRVVWRLGLTTWLSHESEPRANCLARLEVFSCNALASMTLQLAWLFSSPACFTRVPPLATCQSQASREIQSRGPPKCTLLSFSSHFLTHYPYMNPTRSEERRVGTEC